LIPKLVVQDYRMQDFRDCEGQRLVGVAAAWHTHESGPRELVDVWLRLENSSSVHIDVAPDWTLRVESSEPYPAYEMPELSSGIEVEADLAGVPLTQHIGERLRRIVETYDSQPYERKQAEFVFETGSVTAWSFGGDLHLHASDS
jgi:hypothetical protein